MFSLTQEFIGPFDHEAGETHEQVWNSGIFGPGFAAVGSGMHRDGTRLEIGMPLFSGPGLHQTGYSAVDFGRTALYQGDELIGEFDHVDYGTISGLPEEEREYRLVVEADRSTVSTVSTSIAYEWTFAFSAEPEPTLLAVRMAPHRLDEYNRAEVGEPVTIPVTVQSTGAGEVDRCDLSVEVSFDGGHTWEALEVEDGRSPSPPSRSVRCRCVAPPSTRPVLGVADHHRRLPGGLTHDMRATGGPIRSARRRRYRRVSTDTKNSSRCTGFARQPPVRFTASIGRPKAGGFTAPNPSAAIHHP